MIFEKGKADLQVTVLDDEIVLNNISLQIKKKEILKNISLTIKANAITALVGDNGAGKSMLIKVLIGAITPTNGQISIFGINHKTNSVSSLITYVPERMDFPSNMTVRTFFHHILSFESLNNEEIEKRVSKAIEFFDLKERIDEKITNLSMGLKKKVMLCQIILQDRPLIILDEPTANIDTRSRKECLRLLQKLANSGKTVIIVSHILDDLEDSINYCKFLYKGEIIGELDCSQNKTPIDNYYVQLLASQSQTK